MTSGQSPPSLRLERAFWRAGMPRVAGVDEVGRGALAGPLVAAAVVLPRVEGTTLRQLRSALARVRDSKLIPEESRPRVATAVYDIAIGVGIGVVQADELDAIGLGPANRQALERAIQALAMDVDAVLLDAYVTDLGMPQVGVIDGDACCLSIAAASVVAKVTRDAMMRELDACDPRFGFAAHKGYGTVAHLARLRDHGPCAHHRRCFAPVVRAAER